MPNPAVSTLSGFSTSTFTVSASCSISTGVLSIPLETPHYYGAVSDSEYALTGSSLVFRFTGSIYSAQSSREVYCGMGDSPTAGYELGGAANIIGWYINSDYSSQGRAYAMYMVAGTEADITAVEIGQGTPIWLRIREASGTTYWDYSSNGTSWTNLTSVADPLSSTLMGGLYVGADGGYYTASDTGVTVTLDSLNPSTVVNGTCAMSGTASQTVSGSTQIHGTASQSAALAQTASGTTVVHGTVSQSAALSQTARGSAHIPASCSMAAALAQTTTGSTHVPGTVSLTGTLAQTAAASTHIPGSASMSAAVMMTTAGSARIPGTASMTAGFSQTTTGRVYVHGTLALTGTLTQTVGATPGPAVVWLPTTLRVAPVGAVLAVGGATVAVTMGAAKPAVAVGDPAATSTQYDPAGFVRLGAGPEPTAVQGDPDPSMTLAG